MTKAERLVFIRSRVKRRTAFAETAPKPKPEPKRFARYNDFGPMQHLNEMPKQWVCRPDEACDSVPIKPHRTVRKSPLVKIAEHYFERLRRR
jgi:hypothetical protein